MRIVFRQFLGANHSWSVVGRAIARALIQQGHQVDLFSTNGIQYFPEDLKPHLIGYQDGTTFYGKMPDNNYDMTFSFTALKNAPQYLQHSKKNRFLCWVFEWQQLPQGFAKHHASVDLIISPSTFGRDGFITSGIPADKVVVIPHGIDQEQFNTTDIYPLKTKKVTKIFVNIGQSHRRKNIDGIFKSYCAAFTNKDDVCLVAKISKNDMANPFDIDALKTMAIIRERYGSKAPEIELITGYVPNIATLYNAASFIYFPSHAEGFGLPPLEALMVGKVSVCSRYGGMLDFLNDDNSLLIQGKVLPAPLNHQYWQGSIKNQHFMPDMNDCIDKLRYAVANKDALNKKVCEYRETIREKYSWNTIAKQLTDLCK